MPSLTPTTAGSGSSYVSRPGIGLTLDVGGAVTDRQPLGAVDHRSAERVGDANPDLEASRVGRLVAEEDHVERAVGGLEFGDPGSDRRGGALRVPRRRSSRAGRAVDADAHGVTQLLLGLGRAERQHCRLAAVLLDQLDGSLDRALLVGLIVAEVGRHRRPGHRR